jgi:hypothetical protein
MRAGDRLEDVVGDSVHAILDLQLVREHVEQEFRIRIGVDVAAIVLEHFAAQRCVLIRLPLCASAMPYGEFTYSGCASAEPSEPCGRIAAMTNADVAAQVSIASRVNTSRTSPTLVQAQAIAVDRRDAGCVLAAMLEHGQRVIERGRDFRFADDADDSAHGLVTHVEEGFDDGAGFDGGDACDLVMDSIGSR